MSSRTNKLYLPDATELEALRALCRYETHGGYVWAGVMTDGQLMCVPCLRANYRQVFKATRDMVNERGTSGDGWAMEGYTNSGETEDTEYCSHCDKQLWEAQS